MDVLQEIWIESVKKNVDAGNDRLCRLEFRKKLFFVSSYEDSSPAVANLIYLQSLENFRVSTLTIHPKFVTKFFFSLVVVCRRKPGRYC